MLRQQAKFQNAIKEWEVNDSPPFFDSATKTCSNAGLLQQMLCEEVAWLDVGFWAAPPAQSTKTTMALRVFFSDGTSFQ